MTSSMDKSIKINGKKIRVNDLSLEDVVLDRNVMLKFIFWLHKQYCAENILFWLETQNFKYLITDEDLIPEVNRIYDRYFGDFSLNLDEPMIVEELKEKLKLPDRTLFMQSQNAIWALLKYECFPKFKVDYGKSLVSKLSPKLLKQIIKAEPEAVDLYDTFLALTIETVEHIDEFKPTTLPNDDYEEHMHQNLPTINEVWLDRDLMLAFREYLYQQHANDNLSFYLSAVLFEFITPDEELDTKANEIFENFVTAEAPHIVNLDYESISKIEKSLKKPARNMYQYAQERIFVTLEGQWFSLFLTSPIYKSCNDETIEFNITEGGRERSNTMDNYDDYVKMLRKRNRVKNRKKEVKKGDSKKKKRTSNNKNNED